MGSLRECVELLRVVFPHWDRVLVEQVRRVEGTVRVSARTRVDSSFLCPDCGMLSQRAHSRYRRLIADTAVGGQPVATGLSVRRLFCDGADCPRRTFSEQVTSMTTHYGRRTPVLVKVLQAVGLALAGRAGPGPPPSWAPRRAGRPCSVWCCCCPPHSGRRAKRAGGGRLRAAQTRGLRHGPGGLRLPPSR
ncbi:transposase family protein [Pseudarthrobacter sp. P1]|uniref:transposase family protein n=1 Tax=Pseudarthrobacter sp. P1 TaxID=3418418 RepID=UPI003CF7B388